MTPAQRRFIRAAIAYTNHHGHPKHDPCDESCYDEHNDLWYELESAYVALTKEEYAGLKTLAAE